MRQFIRHPADIPIEVSAPAFEEARGRSLNVGLGGLAFRCDCAVAPGSIVRLRIALLDPPFESQARVMWCRSQRHGFDLGVAFLDVDDAYRARMVEQICHILTYRKTVLDREGRSLSTEEAAREWIARFAAAFPNPASH